MPDPYLQAHLDRAALISIDVQYDTLDGQPVEIPGTSGALPAIVEAVRMFRAARRPVVHMVRLYRPDGSNVDLCRRAAVASGQRQFLAGAPGSQLAPGLLPDPAPALDPELLLSGRPQPVGPDEFVFYKPRWGAFFATALDGHLRRRAVDTLVFCGANFPNCPRTSIYEASERDYRLVVVREALSGLSAQGIAELEAIGVSVGSVAGLREQLARAPASRPI